MIGKISSNYSPNFSPKKRIKKNIKFIILHYTGMKSEKKAIKRLSDVKSKVSCHYFIKKNGKIILMVPEIFEAWHAGKSKWKKFNSLNKYSIGIEIQNYGHNHGYQHYNRLQLSSIYKILNYLKQRYKIKKNNILGHSDISFDRKSDPGENFPWYRLSRKKLSIWHNLSEKDLKLLRNQNTSNQEKKKFFQYLKKIGYSFNYLSPKLKSLLTKAFQMRFRQCQVDGKVDKETLQIAKKVSKT